MATTSSCIILLQIEFIWGGLRLNGVDFTFGQGTFIEPNDFVVVAESLSEYQEAYGNTEKVAGEYTGSLDNGGETISLLDAGGRQRVDGAGPRAL